MKKIYNRGIIQIGAYSITPIEQIEVRHNQHEQGFLFSVATKPLGIIIESKGTQWALNMNGQEVAIDELLHSKANH